ncbi:MAG: sugar phosphate isomerase/epimerase family protein [Balneolaceae bacterium]
MNRKDFIKKSSSGVVGLTLGSFFLNLYRTGNSKFQAASDTWLKKGFMLGTFPSREEYSIMEKFMMLKDAGFHGVEPGSGLARNEILDAKDASGLDIPSVVVSTHWSQPLSSPDSSVREAGLKGLITAIEDAHTFGAGCVLLVPGVVNESVSYDDAYHRSQHEIRKAIPLAKELGVVIAIENVWNQFLLSPMEAARYVDEFESDSVGWYMDVGNIMNIGFPEQWIRILGKRIAMVHIKEYSMEKRNEEGPWAGFRVNYLEGDSNWPEIMKALKDVGYDGGYGIAEPAYRDQSLPHTQWLSEYVSDRMDQIFVM